MAVSFALDAAREVSITTRTTGCLRRDSDRHRGQGRPAVWCRALVPLIDHSCENALMENTDDAPHRGGSAGSLLSIGSSGSILSIGSAGSILSIGSAGSILSIGSVGSVASAFSIGSAASAGSILSGLSRWSVLAWRSAGTTGLARRRAAELG